MKCTECSTKYNTALSKRARTSLLQLISVASWKTCSQSHQSRSPCSIWQVKQKLSVKTLLSIIIRTYTKVLKQTKGLRLPHIIYLPLLLPKLNQLKCVHNTHPLQREQNGRLVSTATWQLWDTLGGFFVLNRWENITMLSSHFSFTPELLMLNLKAEKDDKTFCNVIFEKRNTH